VQTKTEAEELSQQDAEGAVRTLLMPFQSRTSLITSGAAFLTEVEGRKYGTFQLQLAYVVRPPSGNSLVVWKPKDHLTVTPNFLKQSPS
jgi:hypothetical protein